MKIQKLAFSTFVALFAAPLANGQDINTFITCFNLINDNFNTGRTLVRLAFHDAMGGCDATVEIGNPEHNGLEDTITTLDALWTNNFEDLDGLTRSDFFAWSYVAGFYMTVPNNNIPWVPLTFGRQEFDGNHNEDIPPGSDVGSGQHQDVLDYFSDFFGFSEREVAVILGAHTLGGAELENSGYIENWTGNGNNPDTFDNEYYQTLIDPGNPTWELVQVPGSGKFQWQWDCNGNPADNNLNGCRDLMLNVDMNLFFNIEDFIVDESTGEVALPPDSNCNGPRIFSDCFPERNGEATHTAVEDFENNNGMFLEEFVEVYGRLIDRVKIDTTLTPITEPAGWPEQITGNNNNGGDDSGDGDNDNGGNNNNSDDNNNNNNNSDDNGNGGNNNNSDDNNNNNDSNDGNGGNNNNDSDDNGNNNNSNDGNNNNNSNDGNGGNNNNDSNDGNGRGNRGNRGDGEGGNRGDGRGRDGDGDGNGRGNGGGRGGRGDLMNFRSVNNNLATPKAKVATTSEKTAAENLEDAESQQAGVEIVQDYTDDFGLPIIENEPDTAADETAAGGYGGMDSYMESPTATIPSESTPVEAAANLQPPGYGLYSSGGRAVRLIVPSLVLGFGTLFLLN